MSLLIHADQRERGPVVLQSTGSLGQSGCSREGVQCEISKNIRKENKASKTISSESERTGTLCDYCNGIQRGRGQINSRLKGADALVQAARAAKKPKSCGCRSQSPTWRAASLPHDPRRRYQRVYGCGGVTLQTVPLMSCSASCASPHRPTTTSNRPLDFNELIIENPAATSRVRAAGLSMTGTGIYPGDIVVVNRARNVAHENIILRWSTGVHDQALTWCGPMS